MRAHLRASHNILPKMSSTGLVYDPYADKGNRTAKSVATAEPPTAVSEPPADKPWSTPEQRKLSLELYRDGKDAIDRWERSGGKLPEEALNLRSRKADHFRSSLSQALSRMTATALERAKRSLPGGFRFHNDPGNVTQEYQVRYRTKRTDLLGGWFDHQDGTIDVNGDPSSGTAAEIYAHELSHAVDWSRTMQGEGYECSSSGDWQDAWEREIDATEKTPLSDKPEVRLSEYARKDAREGFAEFGRLVYTDRERAEKDFPRCWDFWKQKGLV